MYACRLYDQPWFLSIRTRTRQLYIRAPHNSNSSDILLRLAARVSITQKQQPPGQHAWSTATLSYSATHHSNCALNSSESQVMVLPEIAHPGIVGFNEAFYYKKNLWLLLEYCAGVCVCVCVCVCVPE